MRSGVGGQLEHATATRHVQPCHRTVARAAGRLTGRRMGILAAKWPTQFKRASVTPSGSRMATPHPFSFVVSTRPKHLLCWRRVLAVSRGDLGASEHKKGAADRNGHRPSSHHGSEADRSRVKQILHHPYRAAYFNFSRTHRCAPLQCTINRCLGQSGAVHDFLDRARLTQLANASLRSLVFSRAMLQRRNEKCAASYKARLK